MCNDCYEKIINWDQYAEQVQKVQGMFMTLPTNKENLKVNEKTDQEMPTVREKVRTSSVCYLSSKKLIKLPIFLHF